MLRGAASHAPTFFLIRVDSERAVGEPPRQDDLSPHAREVDAIGLRRRCVQRHTVGASLAAPLPCMCDDITGRGKPRPYAFPHTRGFVRAVREPPRQ